MSQPGDEFGRFLDNIIIFYRNVFIWMFFLVAFPLTAIFMHTKSFLCNLAYPTSVEIAELNPYLKESPPSQFLSMNKDGVSEKWVYFRGKTIKDAEDWLVRNDYKCRLIPTKSESHISDTSISYKTFAVKGDIGKPNESVVIIRFTHGDGTIDNIPFRFLEKESPISWNRFKRIEVPESLARADTGKGAGVCFELGYASTHQKYLGIFERISGLYTWPSGQYNPFGEEVQKELKEYNNRNDYLLIK